MFIHILVRKQKNPHAIFFYPQDADHFAQQGNAVLRMQPRLFLFSRWVGPCVLQQRHHLRLPMHGRLPQFQRVWQEHGKAAMFPNRPSCVSLKTVAADHSFNLKIFTIIAVRTPGSQPVLMFWECPVVKPFWTEPLHQSTCAVFHIIHRADKLINVNLINIWWDKIPKFLVGHGSKKEPDLVAQQKHFASDQVSKWHRLDRMFQWKGFSKPSKKW